MVVPAATVPVGLIVRFVAAAGAVEPLEVKVIEFELTETTPFRVQVAVYVTGNEAGVIVSVVPVVVVLQVTTSGEVQPLAVNVTLVPLQILVEDVVEIVGGGVIKFIVVLVAVADSQVPFTHLAEYVPFAVTITVRGLVVLLFSHLIVFPETQPLAVSCTFVLGLTFPVGDFVILVGAVGVARSSTKTEGELFDTTVPLVQVAK
jgi:hypothetical protein